MDTDKGVTVSCCGLEVIVPDFGDQIKKSAAKYLKEASNFLATYMRSVKFDSATNFTAFQVMQLVERLHLTFSDIEGMESVGKELARLLRPLLLRPMVTMPCEEGQEADLIAENFTVSSNDIRVEQSSSGNLKLDCEETATGQRLNPPTMAGNDRRTVFYMLRFLVAYHPKERTFDFYYAFVYCKDTSSRLSHWLRRENDKIALMAALELEASRILGNTLGFISNNAIKVKKVDKPEFQRQIEALSTGESAAMVTERVDDIEFKPEQKDVPGAHSDPVKAEVVPEVKPERIEASGGRSGDGEEEDLEREVECRSQKFRHADTFAIPVDDQKFIDVEHELKQQI